MPIDPKTQPLAALAKKWRAEAKSFRDTARNAAARNKNETWEECDAKSRILIGHAEDLEAALMAQRNVWQDRLLTLGGDEYSCGEIDALGRVHWRFEGGQVSVCDHCSDTHRVSFQNDTGEWVTQMCTYCPVPCQQCRQGGNGPYCETTPCDCECHGLSKGLDPKPQPLVALLEELSDGPLMLDAAEVTEWLKAALEAQRQHLLAEADRIASNGDDRPSTDHAMAAGFRLAATLLKVNE